MSAARAGPTETLTLRPSLRQWWWVVLLFAAGAVAGFFMLRGGNSWGWFVLAFCGLGLFAPLVALWPGAARLRLAPDGFDTKSFSRRDAVRWSDVDEFFVVTMSNHDFVAWRWAAGAPLPAGTRLAERFAGVQAMLPDRYGMKPAALAALMNEWRTRAVSDAGRQSRR